MLEFYDLTNSNLTQIPEDVDYPALRLDFN